MLAQDCVHAVFELKFELLQPVFFDFGVQQANFPLHGSPCSLRLIPIGVVGIKASLSLLPESLAGRSYRVATAVATDDAFLPSGELRRIHVKCRATIGRVGNTDYQNVKLGKAGRKRHLGRRPKVRGTAMNPVDHPLGGGEGRTKGGRHPCSPTGVLAKGGRTRSKSAVTDKFILRRRKKKK